MKKLFVPVSCFAVVLILGKVGFAQSDDAPGHAHSLSVANIVAQAHAPVMPPAHAHAHAAPQALPFGFAPYPMVGGHPAFGIPYSFPRAGLRDQRFEQRAELRAQRFQRPLFSRLAPPPPQPFPLPPPGSAPGPSMMPEQPPRVAPPLTFGQVPQMQGMVVAAPAPPGPPVVVHRPTPLRNLRTLLFAPRPYLGYDPFSGFPPFPGYLPPH
jgi:hypothetical protein